jgi:hypothetical protein
MAATAATTHEIKEGTIRVAPIRTGNQVCALTLENSDAIHGRTLTISDMVIDRVVVGGRVFHKRDPTLALEIMLDNSTVRIVVVLIPGTVMLRYTRLDLVLEFELPKLLSAADFEPIPESQEMTPAQKLARELSQEQEQELPWHRELRAIREQNAILTQEIADVRAMTHRAVIALVCERPNSITQELRIMRSLGIPMGALPAKYVANALIAAMCANDIQACAALTSDAVLRHEGLAYEVCQATADMQWTQCDCAKNHRRYDAPLLVIRWLHVGGAVLDASCLGLARAFGGATPPVCRSLQHAVIQSRVLEIGALLIGMVERQAGDARQAT